MRAEMTGWARCCASPRLTGHLRYALILGHAAAACAHTEEAWVIRDVPNSLILNWCLLCLKITVLDAMALFKPMPLPHLSHTCPPQHDDPPESRLQSTPPQQPTCAIMLVWARVLK